MSSINQSASSFDSDVIKVVHSKGKRYVVTVPGILSQRLGSSWLVSQKSSVHSETYDFFTKNNKVKIIKTKDNNVKDNIAQKL